LFGEETVRGNGRGHCFVEVDRQSIHSLTKPGYRSVTYCITGKTKSARDHFVSWLRYRCEQQMATEVHGNTTGIISGDTSEL
jgi:hypothetical protein